MGDAVLLGPHPRRLTVRDVSVSRPWYRALLTADPIVDEDTGELHNVVWAFSDGTLFGLHQHLRRAPDEEFSELRVGLDHVSFGVENRAELVRWMDQLNELRIRHGGIKDEWYGSGLSSRDPDGIALELFAPPAETAPARNITRRSACLFPIDTGVQCCWR